MCTLWCFVRLYLFGFLLLRGALEWVKGKKKEQSPEGVPMKECTQQTIGTRMKINEEIN